MFTYPIFDYHHFCYFLFLLLLFFIFIIDIFYEKVIKFEKVFFYCIITFDILFLTNIFLSKNDTVRCDMKRFNLFYNDGIVCKYFNKKNKLLDKYCYDSKCILIDSYSVFYKTTNNIKLDYFDVLYYGNLGYNGTSMMIKKIDDIDDRYFIISKLCFNDDKYSQFNREIITYIMKNKKFIGEDKGLLIYK